MPGENGRVHLPTAAPVSLGTPKGRVAITMTLTLTVVAQVSLAGLFVQLGRLVASPTGEELSGGFTWAVVALSASVAATWIPHVSAIGEEAPLRARLLRAWWERPAHMHEQSGRTVGLLTDSVERVASYRQIFLGAMTGAVIAPLAVLVVVAAFVDPLSAGVLALLLPVIPLTIWAFRVAVRSASTASRESRAHLATRYFEAIQGLETLTMLGVAPRVASDLAAVGETNRRATMRLLAGNQLVLLVTDAAFSLVAVTSAAVLASVRLASGAIDAGQALGLVLCSILLIGPLDLVGQLFYIGMSGSASQRAVRRFTSQDALSAPVAASGESDGCVICVSGAALGYGSTRVLEGLDLSVFSGGRVTLLGASGCGKSTLLRALKGDLVPSNGAVTVNGIELTTATQDAIRASSALVAQSTWLFTGTIADNLRLGNPSADDDALWRVLAAVSLDDFVAGAPRGLDTSVGERGLALSGGQAQRLSLARALLSGRRLLLLDEPTSQVDLASEQIILDALDALGPDYTVVLVSHRRSASLPGSRTIRLDGGRLIEGDDREL